MDILPVFRIRTAGYDATQVRIRLYRNPDGLTIEEYDSSTWDAEMILSYIPANATVTLDSITQRATANYAGRRDIPADHLLYGSLGGTVTWPTLTCGDGYLVSWDIPVETPAGNISMEMDLVQRM